ncbi:MAG: hypothetical protein MUP16_04270 [Sedimentisphaerales bacterium]|nr:hypothetical protein [Sedimentisphaerales bacterium]
MEKKKSSMFRVITSREDAVKNIKDSSMAFLVLAGIQGGIGIFIMPSLIIDAVILAILAGLLWWLKSRVIACFLMLMTGLIAVTTFLSLVGIKGMGGRNIILAAIMFWAAVKSVEATFKLHGRFREEQISFENSAEQSNSPNSRIP